MRIAMTLLVPFAVMLLAGPLLAQPMPGPGMGPAGLEYNGKALDQWIREIDDTDPSVREEAIKVVMQYGPSARKAVPALLRQLNAVDLSPKTNAAIALGFVQTTDPAQLKDVVDGLSRLLDSTQGIIRYQAAMALYRIGPNARGAVAKLTRTVTDRDSFEIRRAGASALGVCGHDDQGIPDIRALKALVDAIDDSCKEVRLESLQGLINLGPPTSPADIAQMKVLLERRIKNDKDKSVAIWARVALMRMDGAAINEANLSAIAKLIKFGDLSVGIQAIRALGVVGPAAKAKIPELIDTLQNPEPFLSGEAAWALGRMGKSAEKALPSLRTLAQTKSEYARAKALDAIKEIETAKQ